MRHASVVLLIVLASRGVEARAQSAPDSHFNRTASGGGARTAQGPPSASASASRRAYAAVATTAGGSRSVSDLLAPYTSRPRGRSGSPSAAPPPPPRPPAPAPPRNYFPTGRPGQNTRHHCTPSRAGVLGNRR